MLAAQNQPQPLPTPQQEQQESRKALIRMLEIATSRPLEDPQAQQQHLVPSLLLPRSDCQSPTERPAT